MASTEGFRQKDYLNVLTKFGNEEKRSLLLLVDSQEFDEVVLMLHELTLCLQLAYYSQSSFLKPKESRFYKVRSLNEMKMVSISADDMGYLGKAGLQDACLELIPEIKLVGTQVSFRPIVLPLGDPKPYKMILECSVTIRSILSCVFQGRPTKVADQTPQEHCFFTDHDPESAYQRIKAEKMITFEGTMSNVRSRIEGRQKKSVTFSDRDSVFEFEPNNYNDAENQNKDSNDKKSEVFLRSGVENKENKFLQHQGDRQHRKVLNLKELQLNPKHFIGKRQNKPPKLRLIHDSEESIDSLKPSEGKGLMRKPSNHTEISLKDINNSTSFFKNLNISKEETQNKVISKTYLQAKRDSKESCFSKRGISDKNKPIDGPPIITIELPSSGRSHERNKSNQNSTTIRQNLLADITLAASHRELAANRPTLPNHNSYSLVHRSSSAQNLSRLQQTRSNIDFMNQLTKKSLITANVSEVSDSSGRNFGRSLSAGRRILSTMLSTGPKDQSSTSVHDSLKHSHYSSRDDKIGIKANVLASKLNFLNQYDKQAPTLSLFGPKANDKSRHLDLSIYQKILCGRSKAIPTSTKHAANRIR